VVVFMHIESRLMTRRPQGGALLGPSIRAGARGSSGDVRELIMTSCSNFIFAERAKPKWTHMCIYAGTPRHTYPCV